MSTTNQTAANRFTLVLWLVALLGLLWLAGPSFRDKPKAPAPPAPAPKPKAARKARKAKAAPPAESPSLENKPKFNPLPV